MPGLGAEHRARELGGDPKRISETGKLGVVAGNERIDQVGRMVCVIATEIVQLCSGRRPPPRSSAIDAQGATNPPIIGIRVAQQSLGHADAGVSSALAEQ
jgi:hypothetical protein